VRISELNWMQVEEQRKAGVDRAVLPLGCTEQHAYLSLATDSILAERVAADAAEPLGVPVFPVLPYGITPHFRAYPGTVSLRVETHLAVVRDVLDGLYEHGFRRVLIVNGHGGNAPASAAAAEWAAMRDGAVVRFHNWWNAPRVWAKVQEIDPFASHASWMENFPWTRLANVTMPDERKDMVDWPTLASRGAVAVREGLGDGNFGGRYFRSDDDVLAIWSVAVEETRTLISEL
jgi:creatinine amidohydrolase